MYLEQYEAPRTQSEMVLAGIFADVLRSERVGRRDDFFKLGGNSLTAAKIIARLSSMLAVRIPLWVLFQFPRVSDLAVQIDLICAEKNEGVRPLNEERTP